MTNTRACNICNKSLNNKRLDSKTCSSSCRSKLFRLNQTQSVLVKFRISSEAYTDLTIKAFFAGQSISDHIVQLVVKQ
ncbi:hypothetical protein [Pseudomonas sp. NMI4491_12]|uniref:hypothetical protein n=1 Tax=Pseudomonas sp. NMI4491_12 TaxID=2903146 RepID=UPI001E467777|nr:hypothetical protein [Pseudomonas sp. NMI4491_12]MCE0968502.1 hypothetical protein [Pseudomonas sp. NMI4491_12]